MIDAAFGWSRLRRNEGKVDHDEGLPFIRRRTDVLSLNGLAGQRALRLLRDPTNLAANPDLWSSIEKALASSAWLILTRRVPTEPQSSWHCLISAVNAARQGVRDIGLDHSSASPSVRIVGAGLVAA